MRYRHQLHISMLVIPKPCHGPRDSRELDIVCCPVCMEIHEVKPGKGCGTDADALENACNERYSRIDARCWMRLVLNV